MPLSPGYVDPALVPESRPYSVFTCPGYGGGPTCSRISKRSLSLEPTNLSFPFYKRQALDWEI